jgi:AraC-like DNA-binding protein
VLDQAQASVRSYSGEHQAHAHDHAQILFALQGRMELEVAGRPSFVDSACGMVIPQGRPRLSGRTANPGAGDRCAHGPGLDKLRRFAVPPALRFPQSSLSAAAQMALVLQAPTLLQRRGLDLLWLQQQVQAALHESWPTARLADLVHLSVAQFHARFVELTDRTPQDWLRGLRLDAAVLQLKRGAHLKRPPCAAATRRPAPWPMHCGASAA